MAPLSSLHQSSVPSDFETRLPPLPRPEGTESTLLAPVSTQSATFGSSRPLSPPRRPAVLDRRPSSDLTPRHSRQRDCDGSRSRSRRGKRTWKKLLWVRQSYPDNYTDQATFLENLQRNPRLQPYEFWPLVADSTVIVQHVCSIIIFVACFVGIFQERVSPVSVVSWGSFATFVGWGLWDWWVGQEAGAEATVDAMLPCGHQQQNQGTTPGGSIFTAGGDPARHPPPALLSVTGGSSSQNGSMTLKPVGGIVPRDRPRPVPLQHPHQQQQPGGDHPPSGLRPANGPPVLRVPHQPAGASVSGGIAGGPKQKASSPLAGGRAHLRVNAMKSALLIYFTLLGLSPILKSLTRSTSSDSIWAMSLWLLAINVFFFDYSGAWVGVSNISVPSLSTNAALMASTVLASRLPSTGQVFGLTLFSIEVFGLFPVFRRYARHRSWRYHILLTALLVLGAGAGVGITLARPTPDGRWPWRSGLLGMVLGCVLAAVAMGGCSWWLLGLQKYKNEIHGPWDPARPIIISRRHWDDE